MEQSIQSYVGGNPPTMPGVAGSSLTAASVNKDSNSSLSDNTLCLLAPPFPSGKGGNIQTQNSATPTPFRFQGRHVFLTYPRCPLKKEEALEVFQAQFTLNAYTIGEESHEDGEPHLHAVLSFDRKLHLRDMRCFDIRGYHPNIQRPRKIEDAIKYCQKDGKFVSTHKSKASYGQILEDSSSFEEFMGKIEVCYPRDMVLNYERIKIFGEYRFKTKKQEYTPKYTEFDVPQVMLSWKDQALGDGRQDRPKTLCLVGDTRLGKTQWARSLGRHIYWNNMIDLETYDDQASYVIFDDFDWEYFPNKKGWWGAQEEFTITDKYRRKKTIKWGKAMIWLGNEAPALNEWYRANCIYIQVHSPLYKK